LRILLASHAYPPRRLAGVEVYTRDLARSLSRSHVVGVVYPVPDADRANGSVVRVELGDGVTGYELTQHGRFRSFAATYTGEGVDRALASVLEDFGPDVVHAQHVEGLGTAWLERAGRAGVRVFMTVHDHVLTCANGGQRFHAVLGACPLMDVQRCAACTAHMNRVGLAARRWSRSHRAGHATTGDRRRDAGIGPSWIARGRALAASLDRGGERRIGARWDAMRRLGDALDGLIVPSRSLQRDLLAFGVAPGRIRYVPHGVDVATFRRRPVPERARRFGYLGSIVPHKGVGVLVEAFRGLPAEAELVIAGSLRADADYVGRIVGAGLPANVSLVGEVDRSAVPALLARLDCLVVPSVWEENAPLVVLEAFATGVPVVASRIGGLPELLAQGGGVTVTPGSVDALREVLVQAFDRPGAVAGWARSIPRVRDLAEHVADITRVYERGIACLPV